MAVSLRVVEEAAEGDKESSNQQICTLCLTQFAKYTCPRCNIRYCSLHCYKSEKHLQCSESFYREWFMTELQQRKGSPEEKQKMLEILKRLEAEGRGEREEGGGGGNDTRTLEERLAGLDLDRELDSVWQRLTPAEQREFQEMVKSGRMGHLLTVYTPWWEIPKLVVPLGKSEVGSHLPEVLINLPPLNSLVKSGKVSPCIRYNVLNVLYAYAYTVRLFNGGHQELPLQASQAVLDISSCLSTDASFSMAGEALRHAMTTVEQKQDLVNSIGFSISVMEDVGHILCNPKSHDCHVTQALSDLHRLLAAARTHIKADHGKGSNPLSDSGAKQLWLAKKKVYFFVVWANETQEAELIPLAKIVEIEHESSLKELEEHRQTEDKMKQKLSQITTTKTHKLIEELN